MKKDTTQKMHVNPFDPLPEIIVPNLKGQKIGFMGTILHSNLFQRIEKAASAKEYVIFQNQQKSHYV